MEVISVSAFISMSKRFLSQAQAAALYSLVPPKGG
jgi:hypothetical protein